MLDSLACAVVKVLGAFLCRLSPRVAVGMGAQLGSVAFWVEPKRARIGMANLQAAFDGQLTRQQARRIVHQCYRQLGAGIFELLRLPVIDRAYVDRYVTIEGLRHLKEATASGRPIIFLTGHFGSWEMCSIVAALIGHPIVALARAQKKMPKLYRLLVSYRQSKGCRVAHKGGAMRQLIAALEARQPVGIVGDQASRQGMPVPFFGRPAFFAKGPFELALSRKALVVCAFIHRVDGPSHRLIIEPPFELAADSTREEAVRQGIERFTALLAKHIQQEPSQWLWMHKRWKHTPAKRVLVLSDGKAGHLKQSLSLVRLMREQNPWVSYKTVEVRYHNLFARALTLLCSLAAPIDQAACWCAQWCLTPESARALAARSGDLIVSCGSAVAAMNVLWSRLNRAKSIAIMRPPAFLIPRFDWIIAPAHDRISARRNVVAIPGALSPAPDALKQKESIEHLKRHPNFREQLPAAAGARRISVLIGGETDDFTLPDAWLGRFIEQIEAACRREQAVCAVTGSRRTPKSAEQLLKGRLSAHPRCQLLLLASQDPLNGTMDGLLGGADVVVVTGDSISMVSEACASARPVIAVKLPPRRIKPRRRLKHDIFLQRLQSEGYLQAVAVEETAEAIHRALAQASPAKPWDALKPLRQTLETLLK